MLLSMDIGDFVNTDEQLRLGAPCTLLAMHQLVPPACADGSFRLPGAAAQTVHWRLYGHDAGQGPRPAD